MDRTIKYIFISLYIGAFIYGFLTFDFDNPDNLPIGNNDTIEYLPDMDSIYLQDEFNNDGYEWVPDDNLLYSDLWERVGYYRFECEFLELAIGLTDNGEYALIEMSGIQRILAISYNYNDIQQLVTRLTLKTYGDRVEMGWK